MAFAQSDKSKAESGHYYQGGPKTDVPHQMKEMKANTTGSSSKKSTKEPHGYQGGPKTEVPHKMNR